MSENGTHIKFKCIRVTQPIGTFYVGSISHKALQSICYADIRRLEDRQMDKYLGIQRPLKKNRVAELQKYVNLVDATFPTSIILALSSEHAEYDSAQQLMRVVKKPSVAKIIDGQHRIAGLAEFKGSEFQVNVTVFVDMDIEDQAIVFSTINIKHVKVSKSLMYDLFEFAKTRSPQKTCHTIARLLNKKEDSPFRGKIKVLGTAESPEETLTQATFVDRLKRDITRDDMTDRDMLRRGKQPPLVSGKDAEVLFFRNHFLRDEDAIIVKNLISFFGAVRDKWPSSWDRVQRGNILNRSTGYAALMRVLRPAYHNCVSTDSVVVPKERFVDVFDRVKLRDSDFSPETYVPGSAGEAQLTRDLLEQSGLAG